MYLLASWQPENLFDFGLAPPSLGIRNLSGNWWTGARLWTCHWPDIINQLLKGPKQEKSLGKSITCWATPCWVLIYSADQKRGALKNQQTATVRLSVKIKRISMGGPGSPFLVTFALLPLVTLNVTPGDDSGEKSLFQRPLHVRHCWHSIKKKVPRIPWPMMTSLSRIGWIYCFKLFKFKLIEI